MVYKLIGASFRAINFLLLDYNVHTFAGVAPLLGELVAQTVTVLYEYVCASAAVVCELAVLDQVDFINNSITMCVETNSLCVVFI